MSMGIRVLLGSSAAISGLLIATSAYGQTASAAFKPLTIQPVAPAAQDTANNQPNSPPTSSVGVQANSLPQRPVIMPIRDLTVLPRALPIRRQLPISAIRAVPQVSLGSATVNFTPVLQNPSALFNVTNRLRNLPQLAKVERDEADVVEIDEGLLVRSSLKYTVQPGACANTASRSQLEAAGNSCFRQSNRIQRLSALSNPQSASFIADPVARAAAIANYRAAITADHSELQARAAEMGSLDRRRPAQQGLRHSNGPSPSSTCLVGKGTMALQV